jgi:hypothetical protein
MQERIDSELQYSQSDLQIRALEIEVFILKYLKFDEPFYIQFVEELIQYLKERAYANQ